MEYMTKAWMWIAERDFGLGRGNIAWKVSSSKYYKVIIDAVFLSIIQNLSFGGSFVMIVVIIVSIIMII